MKIPPLKYHRQRLSINHATLSDIPGLAALEKQCFTQNPLTTKNFRYFIKRKQALLLVAKDGKQLVGHAVVLLRKNSSIARLYSIAICKPYRKKGVAQALHDVLIKKIRQKCCSEIRLEVYTQNAAALSFYLKNGYSIFASYKDYYDEGEDAWRMKKRLDQRRKNQLR